MNDYVEPGDLLVSGILKGQVVEDEENESEERQEQAKELVAAEAEITANTWYEVSVTVPLEFNYEEITGNQKRNIILKQENFSYQFGDLESLIIKKFIENQMVITYVFLNGSSR